MIDILELVLNIKPLDRGAINEARNHFDNLIKPKGLISSNPKSAGILFILI